jgi:glycosyltransferase involved in cell wall biosynthesis
MKGISIIIPTYNREDFIAEAIQSILIQNYEGPIEIIITDDGSTDKTIEIAETFGEKIRILRKGPNCTTQGASSSRNRGIRIAKQDYICFLDSDDYFLPGHLKKITGVLESDPELSYVFCRIFEKIELTDNVLYTPWTKEKIAEINVRYPVVSGNNVVCTNSFIFKREIFKEIGLFNESYSNGEDADMWMRISERYKGSFSDHYGAVRRRHGSTQLTYNPGKKTRQDHFEVYIGALRRCYAAPVKDRYRIRKLKMKLVKYVFYSLRIVKLLDRFYVLMKQWLVYKKHTFEGTFSKTSSWWNEIFHYYESGDMDVRFLINTGTFWDEPPRARHQVTRALAKHYKVAFVAANHVGVPKLKFSITEENTLLIQPYYPFDFRIRYRLPIINELYQRWLFKKLKLVFGNTEVINFDFTAYLLHKYFSSVNYYCNDNFVSISKKLNFWPIYLYHIACERKLISKAKLCIGTSSIIVSKLVKRNLNTHEILLGGPNIEEYDIKPRDKRNGKGPINIGLVGFIRNYNLSYQLLNEIIDQIDCTLTLIGPVEPDFFNHINKPEKVIIKGIMTDHSLLNAVNEFDVAIAPYLSRKIEEGGMPNKLFIYLSLGKPVIMTELKSLIKMNLPEKLVYLVGGSQDFSSLILKAHDENNWNLIQERVRYAKENTWDIRIDDFLSHLNENPNESETLKYSDDLVQNHTG